jgi:predicted methyltransferase
MYSDPQGLIDFAGALYTDRSFYLSLFKGLSEDGILISQVGEALAVDDKPRRVHRRQAYRAGFVRGLIDIGFEGVRDYQEVRFSL